MLDDDIPLRSDQPRLAPLRVGIVGAGFMGGVHADAARAAGAEIVGLMASSVHSAASHQAALGANEIFDSIDRLLDSGIDILHVCTPNALHFPMARAALERGVHVICEKPLATTVSDALALTELADRHSLVATIPFVYRFHPMVREMRQRLVTQDGSTALVSVFTYRTGWPRPVTAIGASILHRLGGSRVFADIGSHWFDLVEFVLGRRVVRLSARFAQHFPNRLDRDSRPYAVSTEDSVTVQFELEGGELGVFAGSQVARGRKNRLFLEVSGDQLSVAFDQENPEQLWAGTESGNLALLRDPAILHDDAARFSVLPAGHVQGYSDCFPAFVADTYRAIRGATPDGLPTFTDGLRSAVLVESVIDSASRDGAWVECAPLPESEVARA